MIFWRYTALFFSAITLLSLQKMPCLSPKSLSQNAELILCPLLSEEKWYLEIHQITAESQTSSQRSLFFYFCKSL